MKFQNFVAITLLLIVLTAIFLYFNAYTVTQDVKYVEGYDEFELYYTSDFSQSIHENNCGPTEIANILEYYSNVKGLNLYEGRITQKMYDDICKDVKYDTKIGTVTRNEIKRTKSSSRKIW